MEGKPVSIKNPFLNIQFVGTKPMGRHARTTAAPTVVAKRKFVTT